MYVNYSGKQYFMHFIREFKYFTLKILLSRRPVLIYSNKQNKNKVRNTPVSSSVQVRLNKCFILVSSFSAASLQKGFARLYANKATKTSDKMDAREAGPVRNEYYA